MERIQETLFSSHRSECTHCTARARRQLLKAAVNGPPRDSLVTVRARSRWAGRLAAGRYQVSMGRIKIKVRLAAAGIVRLDRPEGWAGNEGGQDADPPVHAARAQDAMPRALGRSGTGSDCLLVTLGDVPWLTMCCAGFR